jgi:hypothetical protein
MISDVLAEAVTQIDAYLSDPAFREAYQGDVLTRIRLVRHAMVDLCQELVDQEPKPRSRRTERALALRKHPLPRKDEVADRMQAAADRALEKVRQELEGVSDTQTPPSGELFEEN